tara:strand:+ start:82 stop:303 length:222 start_codon:yes stop_codon:yes gene_type:complete
MLICNYPPGLVVVAHLTNSMGVVIKSMQQDHRLGTTTGLSTDFFKVVGDGQKYGLRGELIVHLGDVSSVAKRG